MTDQRCGTCKYWGKQKSKGHDGTEYANCEWPTPHWMQGWYGPASAGTDCSCWKPEKKSEKGREVDDE